MDVGITLRRDRSWFFAANIFDGIIFVQENDLWLVFVRCFRWEVNEARYNKLVAWFYEVRCSPVNVNLTLFRAAIKDIRFESSAGCYVPYVDSFMREKSGEVEEVAGNGDAALIVHVGLGNDGAVNLRK